ncbi:MAG: hypothetical protein E7658_00635 [Ruminococcaceae bacterium]|nr:hypothetical protein [Oscillospiraceae bacterium]
MFENGEPLYTLVRPAKGSDVVSDAASLVWKTFANSFGCELPFTDDWTEDVSSLPADATEILIGNTNRTASSEITASLGENLYRITCEGNRIVIAACADSQLQAAAEAFLHVVTVDENGRITIPADLDLIYSAKDAWPHEDIPYYEGGSYCGVTATQSLGWAKENPSLFVGISDTNAEEFAAYIQMLADDGYTLLQRSDTNGITAYQCDKEEISLYAYYTAATNEVRIIREKGKSVPIEKFGYTYEPKEGETTDVFLFGLRMLQAELDYTENYKNNGQFLFIKLADNSLLLIDGGSRGKQNDTTPSQVDFDEFLRIAREVTGTPENEKIRIACWFITHCHADHYSSFRTYFYENPDLFTLERVMYNLYDGEGTDVSNDGFNKYHPDALYHKPHTGETIQLGNLKMEVLYAQEDWYDASTMLPASEEVNDSGTVIKIHFDDKSFLVLGDLDKYGADTLLKYYPTEVLKSDIVQIAHHGYNQIRNLYEAADAKIGLVPQAYSRMTTQPQLTSIYNSLTENFEELYYAGEETVGVQVVDGELQVFYRSPVVYKPVYD